MSEALIISDSRVLSGKPVIAGTRISVELIMNFLAAGMNVDQILSEYPELRRVEIEAAINYAMKVGSKKKFSASKSQTTAATPHEITRG